MSFITPAYAQAAGEGASTFVNIIPFILIFVVMYFLIIRPQRAQMKKHQEMIRAVRRGDNVVTGGGFIGKVTKVFDADGEVEVELADNVRVKVLRSTLSSVRSKTEVTGQKTAKKSDENSDKTDSDETVSVKDNK